MWLMLLGKGSLFRMGGRRCRQEAGERIKTSSTCGVAKVWIEREGGHASVGDQHFLWVDGFDAKRFAPQARLTSLGRRFQGGRVLCPGWGPACYLGWTVRQQVETVAGIPWLSVR